MGFFATAKYRDGTPVTNVAAWLEFGTRGGASGGGWGGPVPERPYFRNASQDFPTLVREILEGEIDPQTMVVTRLTAGRVGEACKARLQESITDLKEPPNAPVTLVRKAPKDNPLIWEGFLRAKVSWEIPR